MSDSWKQRRLRTGWWLGRECPAEPMLELYLELLELQEPLYGEALASDRGAGAAAGDGGPPYLDLTRLPVPALVPRFRSFLGDLAPAVTEVLAGVLETLEAAGEPAMGRLLEDFLHRTDGEELARELGCEPAPLRFFPRAFLQPLAEALAQGNTRDLGEGGEGKEKTCPRCGWPPQVSVLRDEAEVKGRRLLVCSLCATPWRFRRSTCPSCGEEDPEKLLYHVSESLPYVRVEECQGCRAYVKGVDLRKDGRAVPVVEDIASVELDLWADERGLWKIQRNLLGL